MTSESRETALLGGQPIQLFRFVLGDKVWRYTNADTPQTFNGDVYEVGRGIAHGKINDGGESKKATVSITMPKDLPVAALWRTYPPSGTVGVTIWTQHVGEDDYIVDWVGRVVSPSFDDTKLSLNSDSSRSMARRNGRGRRFQRSCDLLLGSQGVGMCNVDLDAHALDLTLDSVAGVKLTSAAFLAYPSGRLAGGWVQWTRADGRLERRDIVVHIGNAVTLLYGDPDLVQGLAVRVYPGCGQSWSDCVYFENQDNFGGELFMPGRSYWDGNVVR
jgi:uncharacterized phage protein (TIGR02218 family)